MNHLFTTCRKEANMRANLPPRFYLKKRLLLLLAGLRTVAFARMCVIILLNLFHSQIKAEQYRPLIAAIYIVCSLIIVVGSLGTLRESMPVVSLYFLLHLVPCIVYCLLSLALISLKIDATKEKEEDQLSSIYLTLAVYLLYNVTEGALLAAFWLDLRVLWLEAEWQNHLNSFKR